jgi:hypothetical protein
LLSILSSSGMPRLTLSNKAGTIAP